MEVDGIDPVGDRDAAEFGGSGSDFEPEDEGKEGEDDEGESLSCRTMRMTV